MLNEWLAQHPFLLRDLRRLRKKARLARFALGPLCATALLLIALFALPSSMKLPGLSRVDLAMILVSLMQALSVVCAADPLGGWMDETAGGRVESLTLLPLAARRLAASAVERRLYLKLILAALFIPFYVPLCALNSQFLLPAVGLAILLALAAWTTATLSTLELTAARNMAAPAPGKVRQTQSVNAAGWLVALVCLPFLYLFSAAMYSSIRELTGEAFFARLGVSGGHLLDIPLLSLPLLLGGWVLRPESFFRFDLPPILPIAVFAYCTREIRILSAARALRSEVIVITTPARRTLALVCPPVERIQEDRPIRRLQIVRGLVFRLGVFGFLWPLLQLIPTPFWNYILLPLIAFGALTGIVQASFGSRSILLPGRVEQFFREKLPTGVDAGMVVVPRLAVRLFAEVLGWELLTVGIICAAGGISPELRAGQAAALLSMIVVSLMAAEACAVGYTLLSLPKVWVAKKDFPRWNSGALLNGGTPGIVAALFFAPPALFVAAMMLTEGKWLFIVLPYLAISPLAGWGFAIINPAAHNLYPAIWVPALVLDVWMMGLVLQDRFRGANAQYCSTAVASLPGHLVKAPYRRRSNTLFAPVSAWVCGWLLRLKQTWDGPFVALEWARMQRKPGMAGGPVVALLVLDGAIILCGSVGVVVARAYDTYGQDPYWMTTSLSALLARFEMLGSHPCNLAVVIAGAAIFSLAFGPFCTLLAAAGAFDRHRKLVTLRGNLAYLLITPLSDGELFWGMVKGALFGQLPFSIIAVAAAAPLAVVSLLLGFPALILLIGVVVFGGITLAGTLLLAVVSGCTGPERWRSFWVGMAPLAMGAVLIAGYAIPVDGLSYSSQVTFTVLYGVMVTLLLFPLSLGFFKLGLQGIHHYRERDVAEG